jgi:hypothetical protein
MASAQTIIPTVGLTYSKTTRSAEETQYHFREVNFRSGFMGGLLLESAITDNLQFRTGLLYIQKGQKASEKGKIGPYYFHSRDIFSEHLQMPLLLKWTIRKGKLQLYPQLGMSVGYGLGGKVNSSLIMEDSNGQMLKGSQDGKIRFTDYKRGYPNDIFVGNPLDLGIQAGIGTLLFDRIILELSFNRGLRSFEYYSGEEDFNKNFQLSLGLPFKIKRNKIVDKKLKMSRED